MRVAGDTHSSGCFGAVGPCPFPYIGGFSEVLPDYIRLAFHNTNI